jgi:hypothetical protein
MRFNLRQILAAFLSQVPTLSRFADGSHTTRSDKSPIRLQNLYTATTSINHTPIQDPEHLAKNAYSSEHMIASLISLSQTVNQTRSNGGHGD